MFLITLGLTLVGFGLTILFGAPQALIAAFPYWPQTGAMCFVAGLLLSAGTAISGLRRAKKPPPAQDAADDPVTRAELDAQITRLLSEVQIREQWKANATNYGDDIRVQALEGELATLRVQLEQANARVLDLAPAARPGIGLTAIVGDDRVTFTNRAGEDVTVQAIAAEGDPDLTMRKSPPFVLPTGGGFDVKIHRILGRTENPVVVIRWTDRRGLEHIQRVGL